MTLRPSCIQSQLSGRKTLVTNVVKALLFSSSEIGEERVDMISGLSVITFSWNPAVVTKLPGIM